MYYLCLQGVWFLFGDTEGALGDCSLGTHKEVQQIPPPSSPVYNVTYVTQWRRCPTVRWKRVIRLDIWGHSRSSVTAGRNHLWWNRFLLSAFIMDFTAMGIPTSRDPYPYTYGGAISYYNSATGRYGVSQSVYGPYGSATRRASYNPYTGTYGRSGTVSTPYGRVSGGQAYNPYTGAYGATRQGSNAYSQWGSSVVAKNGRSAYTQHYSGARGTVGSIQGSQGGAAVGAVGRGGDGGFAGKSRQRRHVRRT